MLLNFVFYEVKTSQQVHYSSSNCCAHVCTTIVHFGEFPLCWMYWVMESNTTLLLLWWLGCSYFVELLIVFLQWQNLLWFVELQAMFLQRNDFFGPFQCAIPFAQFNGCFYKSTNFLDFNCNCFSSCINLWSWNCMLTYWHCKSLVLERPILGVQSPPPKCLCSLMLGVAFSAFKWINILESSCKILTTTFHTLPYNLQIWLFNSQKNLCSF
jgi:hypothetical protein